jgi:DNA mismatch endonuclease (patch repair protein)
MADNHTKASRHYNMSRIKSTDTKSEKTVRKYLFSRGLRYRKNDRRLPGKPDLVFKKYKTVVFVNGCFWHHHDCSRFKWPSSNTDYWHKKINRNVERDEEIRKTLEEAGWRVLVIWECELKKKVAEENLRRLYEAITAPI